MIIFIKLGQVDYYGGDTSYGQLTIISQSNTESILNRRLELDTEYSVHWETELVSFAQDKDKVIATVRDKKTGKEQKIESTYIVGADGSRSKVRKEDKDWTFDGMADKTRFALADVELSGEDLEEFNDRLNLLSAGTGKYTILIVGIKLFTKYVKYRGLWYGSPQSSSS
jgi:2-polyprenyl-6-methoxyphenol hydroxylase-like FAD-dependent oxidoreductase